MLQECDWPFQIISCCLPARLFLLPFLYVYFKSSLKKKSRCNKKRVCAMCMHTKIGCHSHAMPTPHPTPTPQPPLQAHPFQKILKPQVILHGLLLPSRVL